MTFTASAVPPTGLHRVVSVIQLSLLACQLSVSRPSSASANLSRQPVLLPQHASPCVPPVSPAPLASTRLMPLLQVSSHALLPSALCHELRVRKLIHALLLKLLALDPSYCPLFFVGVFFQIGSPSYPSPQGHILLCPGPMTVPGPGFTCRSWSCGSGDTLHPCWPCSAGRTAERCLIH